MGFLPRLLDHFQIFVGLRFLTLLFEITPSDCPACFNRNPSPPSLYSRCCTDDFLAVFWVITVTLRDLQVLNMLVLSISLIRYLVSDYALLMRSFDLSMHGT